MVKVSLSQEFLDDFLMVSSGVLLCHLFTHLHFADLGSLCVRHCAETKGKKKEKDTFQGTKELIFSEHSFVFLFV